MKKRKLFILSSLLISALLGTTVSCGETPNSNDSSDHKDDGSIKDDFDCITIQKAIEYAMEAGESGTQEQYYVYGVVKTVLNPNFGQLILKDETGEIEIYGINDYATMENKIYAGDEIVILGSPKTFNDKAEFGRVDVVAYKHNEPEINEGDYEALKIDAARNKAKGTKVKITGTVAKITYASGLNPNGFILSDDTSSIYVYGKDAVQKVKEGNKITLIGTRDNYINDNEKSSAEKFGYTGAIQVTDVQILENDNKESDFKSNWIKEDSIKNILATPLSTNITGLIYKTKAYVHKAPGNGFTNYYLNDLDDYTGTYSYSSSNGNDYTWLDEFDNKLCDVYLTPLNVKCQNSGYNYRFVPINCEVSNYVMKDDEVCKFALDYYLKDQINTEYAANPNLELITKFNNEKHNIVDAIVTYESSDLNVVYFKEEGAKLYLNTKNPGTSNVTIKVNYKGNEESATLKVTVKDSGELNKNTVNVKGAIDTKIDSTCKVKGIVYSGIPTRPGCFYLIDETGIIGIESTSELTNEISIGDEVVIEGKRIDGKASGYSKSIYKQSRLTDAKLIVNNYGDHKLPENNIVKTTIKEINKFDVNEDHTTTLYEVNGKVSLGEGSHPTLTITSNDSTSETLTVYHSKASQYDMFKELEEKDNVTIRFLLSNWNNKTFYKCVITEMFDSTIHLYNTFDLKK